MEASIIGVLKNIQTHRDHKQIQELVKAEENQSHSLLALKLEEFKNLRKEDILSKLSLSNFIDLYFYVWISFTFWIDAMKTQLEQDISSQKTKMNKTLFYVVQMEYVLL